MWYVSCSLVSHGMPSTGAITLVPLAPAAGVGVGAVPPPQAADPAVIVGETDYGVTFASVLARDNIVATQFHPEKSGELGLRMYKNFLAAL